MADTPKRYPLSGKTTPQFPYQVGSGKAAVLRAAIAANTGNAAATVSGSLMLRRAGVITQVGDTIDVAAKAAANLIAGNGPISLEYGDEVGVLASDAASFARKWLLDLAGKTGNVYALMVGNSGNTIIAGCANGFWRSTDAGATWTRSASAVTIAQEFPHAYIGSNYFVYTSNTTALKSTDDGLTWSSVAVTNAPAVIASATGSICKNGSTYYGLYDSTHTTSTTDGTTWTQGSGALPQACASICHTGTNIVCGRAATSPDIYYSTNGSSWTSVTSVAGVSGAGGINKRGLVGNGAGVVLATGVAGTTLGRSADNGANWTSTSIPLQVTTTDGDACQLYSGSVFYLAGDSNKDNISTGSTGVAGSWYTNSQANGSRGPINAILGSGKVITAYGDKVALSADGSLTPSSGMDFTLSLLEVAV